MSMILYIHARDSLANKIKIQRDQKRSEGIRRIIMYTKSKHLSQCKIKKVKGVELTVRGMNCVSIQFPRIIFPGYWDAENQVFVDINSNKELEEAIQKEIKLDYGGQILIRKDSKPGKEIKKAIDKLWKYYSLDKVKKPRYGKNPLEDGDLKAEELEAEEKNGDIYKGHWILRISSRHDNKKNRRRFKSFDKIDRSGNYLPRSDSDVDGFYVNLGITIDFYEYGNNIGLKVYMNAVQFLEQNPDLEFGTNYSNEFDFEEASDETKEDALTKALGDEEPDDGVPLVEDDNEQDAEGDDPWES